MKYKVLIISLLLTSTLYCEGFEKKTTKELIQIVNNPNATQKKQAISELGKREEDPAFQALKEIILNKNNNWIFQAQAIDTLGASKKQQGYQFLYELLENPKYAKEKRAAAAKALSEFKNKEVIPLYINILKREDDSLVKSQVLINLEPYPTKETIEAVIEALKVETKPFQKMALIELLGKWKAEPAIPYLKKLLTKEDNSIKSSTVQSLASINFSLSKDALIQALQDKNDKELILQTLTFFSTSNDPTLSKEVIPLLNHKDKDVQFLSIYTLGELGDPESVEPLKKLYFSTKNKKSEINRELLLELQRDYLIVNAIRKIYPYLGTDVFFDAVKPIKLSTNTPFHIQAKTSIEQLREAAFEGLLVASNPDIPKIIVKNKLTEDPAPIVRKMATLVLGSYQNSLAVDALIQALKDKEPSVRWTAAQALGKIKKPQAIDPLIKLLDDPHPQVVIQAMQSLTQFPFEKANQALLQFNERQSLPKQMKEISKQMLQKNEGFQ